MSHLSIFLTLSGNSIHQFIVPTIDGSRAVFWLCNARCCAPAPIVLTALLSFVRYSTLAQSNSFPENSAPLPPWCRRERT